MPRCEATVSTPGRATFGDQCRRNAVKGTTHCERHGGVEDAERRGVPVAHKPGSFRQVCTATKRDGTPCSKWAIQGAFVCRTHGGHLPNVQASARKRMLDLLPLAVQRLHTILESPETADADALRAVAMLFDRTGLGPQSEVSVELKPWERLLTASSSDGGIFRRIDPSETVASLPTPARSVDEDALDAEIVEDRDVEALGEPTAPVTPIRVGSANPPRGSRLRAPAPTSRHR